jgi:uncharacterized protein YaaQ
MFLLLAYTAARYGSYEVHYEATLLRSTGGTLYEGNFFVEIGRTSGMSSPE